MSFPVKINSTIVRGLNDNQVVPLFNYCRQRGIEIRFIELMEMGHLRHEMDDLLYPAKDILRDISTLCNYKKNTRESGSTTEVYQTDDGYTFGIIANSSHPFCSDCDRLRLDSRGNVYGCLSESEGESLQTRKYATDLTQNQNIGEIPESPASAQIHLRGVLKRALGKKRTDRFTGSSLSMKSIGG